MLIVFQDGHCSPKIPNVSISVPEAVFGLGVCHVVSNSCQDNFVATMTPQVEEAIKGNCREYTHARLISTKQHLVVPDPLSSQACTSLVNFYVAEACTHRGDLRDTLDFLLYILLEPHITRVAAGSRRHN